MTAAPAAVGDRLAYSPAEAAAVLGVDRATVYRRLASGDLPARKLGTRTLILAADLGAYVASLPAYGEAS